MGLGDECPGDTQLDLEREIGICSNPECMEYRAELEQKLQVASDEITGNIATFRSQSTLLGQARRESDPLKRAREHELWPRIERAFVYWQKRSGHRNSKLDAKRFKLARPFFDEESDEMCLTAIEGVCTDPGFREQANGRRYYYNWWEDAFRDRASFERACNKAPTDFDPKKVAA